MGPLSRQRRREEKEEQRVGQAGTTEEETLPEVVGRTSGQVERDGTGGEKSGERDCGVFGDGGKEVRSPGEGGRGGKISLPGEPARGQAGRHRARQTQDYESDPGARMDKLI